MTEPRFFVCDHCGNLVVTINDAKVPMMCCGQKMTELVANTVEASAEKHLPVVTVEGDSVRVNIGSAAHPMLPEHFIGWVWLQTEKGGQLKYLQPGDAPEVSFSLAGDKPAAAYAFCNLHGLWKTVI